jgi:hypothetical protein
VANREDEDDAAGFGVGIGVDVVHCEGVERLARRRAVMSVVATTPPCVAPRLVEL